MATSTNSSAAQKAIDEQNVYIRDTLMSIASNYAGVLKDAVEGAFDSAEASTMAAVGKDLTRTFTRLAKMSGSLCPMLDFDSRSDLLIILNWSKVLMSYFPNQGTSLAQLK